MSVAGDDDGVVFYWRHGCVYCINLQWQLRRTSLEYTRVNISRHPEAAAFVRSVADGNETVPTVTVGGHAMVNPSKAEVLAAVAAHAPHLLAEAS